MTWSSIETSKTNSAFREAFSCFALTINSICRKALEPEKIEDEELKYLFALIKKIDHPNIMKVDYFIENDVFYVIRTYDDDYVTYFFWKFPRFNFYKFFVYII